MATEREASTALARAMGLPVSKDSKEAISSERASRASAILCSQSARSSRPILDHNVRASSAALTAFSTSFKPDLGILAITSPVAGFKSSKKCFAG